MKKIIVVVILLLAASIHVNAQDVKGDSLRLGRICKLILYNGYQTEGKITERNNDTLTLETDIINLYIPVKDIKFVLNPEFELSDLEESNTNEYDKITELIVKIDTTSECDIYLENKSVMKDVRLIIDTDSTLRIVKNERSKIINIAGIRKIVFKPVFPFGKGYFIGTLIGFGAGIITAISLAGSHTGHYLPGILLFGLIASIPAGIIGGVIGVITASDDVYLFNKGINQMKIKRIRYIIEKHY